MHAISRGARAALLLLTLGRLAAAAEPAVAAPDPWQLPREGDCDAGGRVPGVPDPVPLPFRTGDVLERERAAATLGPFLPEELWANRERFFYDGMKLEIGPCYRDYAPPEFFTQATLRFRGQARLGPDGALLNHTAGLPFPPDTIHPADPSAALRWAWNWTARYDAGGSYGAYRMSLLSREFQQRFEGESFLLPLVQRSDRAADGYRYPSPLDVAWVAGGESRNRSTGAECKFRQYATGGRQPDYFYWHSAARKVERGTAGDSEGPLGGCLADASIGDGLFLHGGSPQLHHWTLVGVRDVLAPINANVPSYPEDKERGFGPSGISFAGDRWELRRALVIEGQLKQGTFADGVIRFRWYLDLQTLFPLYYAAYRRDTTQGGLGYFVGRWSEDRPDYPRWPDDPTRPVRVLDDVGSALVDWNNQEIVRTESWNTVAVPRDETKLRRDLSLSGLRGR